MLTIVTIAVPIALVGVVAAFWWVMRDPTPPPPSMWPPRPLVAAPRDHGR